MWLSRLLCFGRQSRVLFVANLARSDHFPGKAANIAVKVAIIVDVNNQVPQTTLGGWSRVIAQWADSKAVSEEQLLIKGGWNMLAEYRGIVPAVAHQISAAAESEHYQTL